MVFSPVPFGKSCISNPKLLIASRISCFFCSRIPSMNASSSICFLFCSSSCLCSSFLLNIFWCLRSCTFCLNSACLIWLRYAISSSISWARWLISRYYWFMRAFSSISFNVCCSFLRWNPTYALFKSTFTSSFFLRSASAMRICSNYYLASPNSWKCLSLASSNAFFCLM